MSIVVELKKKDIDYKNKLEEKKQYVYSCDVLTSFFFLNSGTDVIKNIEKAGNLLSSRHKDIKFKFKKKIL